MISLSTGGTSYEGKLFDGRAGNILEKYVGKGVQEIVEMGEDRLASILKPRPAGVFLAKGQAQRGKASTGNYRRNLHSKVTGISGVIHDSGVIYGGWLEGTSSRNKTTRFKGYGSFRKTKDWLNKQVEGVMNKFLKKAATEIDS